MEIQGPAAPVRCLEVNDLGNAEASDLKRKSWFIFYLLSVIFTGEDVYIVEARQTTCECVIPPIY